MVFINKPLADVTWRMRGTPRRRFAVYVLVGAVLAAFGTAFALPPSLVPIESERVAGEVFVFLALMIGVVFASYFIAYVPDR